MKITIHQSLCGEQEKAWSLLQTTMLDKSTAKSIAFKTDLQEQTGGINWVPAIRGFGVDSYYVVMKTFEDTSSDVRRGRKFSHVLILEKRDLENLHDLNVVLNLLPVSMDKEAPIEPITVELQIHGTPPTLSPKFQQRFNKLVHGYLKIKEYSNVLLWLGQKDFELAITELWTRLTFEERLNLNFGITFNNEMPKATHLNLMAVPDGIQSKFLKTSYFTVAKEDAHTPVDLVEQILLGDDTAKRRLYAFKETFQIKFLLRNDISFIAKGIDTFENLSKTSDFKKINTLSHIIAKYAPSPKHGEQYKLDLLNRIIHLANTVSYTDLMVLRTFKVESYKDSQSVLSNALTIWMKGNIFKTGSRPGTYNGFFEQQTHANPNWWDNIVDKQLKSFLGIMDKAKAEVIYAWFKDDIAILEKIEQCLDKSSVAEMSLTEKLPKNVNPEIISTLKRFSIEQNWFRLYATLLVRQFSFEKALTELLQVDQEIDSLDALNIILKNSKPKEVVAFAVDNGDERLLKIAGKLCTQSPNLFNSIDVLNKNWQAIWWETIKNGNAVDKGIKNVKEKLAQILDGLNTGTAIREELLEAIANSEYGNILWYEHRIEAWPKLPPAARILFLKKTATALLEDLSKNPSTEIPDDELLRNYITRFGINDFVYYNRSKIRNVIPIFENFSLDDDYLKNYINNYTGVISAIDAKHLGELIKNKRYSSSTYAVYEKATKDNNWRFALSECHDMLDVLTKGAIFLWGTLSSVAITEDQWWESAEELIIELYPDGASLQTLWRKSGGRESDLIMQTTPANVWHNALYKLRRGGFEDVTMNDLLKEIDKRYGKNEKFRIIYRLRKEFL